MSKAAKKAAHRANTPHPERKASNGILYKYRGLENLINTLDTGFFLACFPSADGDRSPKNPFGTHYRLSGVPVLSPHSLLVVQT